MHRYTPMLATTRPQLVLDDCWAVEPKLDGWRALVYCDEAVTVRTKSGRDATASVPELAALSEHVPSGTVLDGELVTGQGRPSDFYRVAPTLATRRRIWSVSFVAFDVLVLEGRSVIDEPYLGRRRLLEELALGGPSWCTSSSFRGAPREAITACLEQGLEGVVLKRLDSRYTPGKRSRHWVKAKSTAWRTVHAPARHDQ